MSPAIGVGVSPVFSQRRALAVARTVDAGLFLAAVVDLIGKTTLGDRIILVEPAWRAILAAIDSDPDAMFKITPRKWEELIAAAYDAEGYRVELTPRSGDGGVDVIATCASGTVKIFDQVKAYGRTRVVTADDVRALMGVVAYSEATKGVLTTTAEFAPRLREDRYIRRAIEDGLELVNGEKLLARLRGLHRIGQ